MTLPGAFRAYLSSPSRKIPKAQKDQLQNDYNGYIKNNANVDQYKYALYRIIGRFDLGRGKVAVASTSTDDWVWLKLTLVREGREDNPSDHYDLAAFGDECWKNGSKTFDAKGTRPFTWVNILLFAGHFEPVRMTPGLIEKGHSTHNSL
jgi:nuclear pore complex protein Nup93